MIHKVKNVPIRKERGVEWTNYKHGRGVTSFHAATQKIELDCDFSVFIDMDKLVKLLGTKAAFSKGGRSQLARGVIQLICTGKRVVKDERIPARIPDGYVKIDKQNTPSIHAILQEMSLPSHRE